MEIICTPAYEILIRELNRALHKAVRSCLFQRSCSGINLDGFVKVETLLINKTHYNIKMDFVAWWWWHMPLVLEAGRSL